MRASLVPAAVGRQATHLHEDCAVWNLGMLNLAADRRIEIRRRQSGRLEPGSLPARSGRGRHTRREMSRSCRCVRPASRAGMSPPNARKRYRALLLGNADGWSASGANHRCAVMPGSYGLRAARTPRFRGGGWDHWDFPWGPLPPWSGSFSLPTPLGRDRQTAVCPTNSRALPLPTDTDHLASRAGPCHRARQTRFGVLPRRTIVERRS